MFIRNQDKTVLLQCNNIIVQEPNKKRNYWRIVCTTPELNYTYLGGKYSSKEKAIKVLDMLEEWSFKRQESRLYSSRGVFQFPLDEEVNA